MESNTLPLVPSIGATPGGPVSIRLVPGGGAVRSTLTLRRGSHVVRRLVLLNTWMWSFRDDAEMMRKGRMASGTIGRLLYRYANFSLRVLTPYAYGDRAKLTPRIHQQYLAPFRDPESR